MRFLLATSLLAVLPGCSWLFVEAPPVGHEQLRYFDCTESRLAPIVDTSLAVLYGATTIGMIADSVGGGEEVRGSTTAMMIVSGAVAATFGVSAGHGFVTTAECDRAKAQWARRTLEGPPLPAPPQPAAPAPPAGPRPCGSDADCAGDRICEQGACVLPLLPPASPPPMPASATSPAPLPATSPAPAAATSPAPPPATSAPPAATVAP